VTAANSRPQRSSRSKAPMPPPRLRARLARRHAESLALHLEIMGWLGEAAAARTIVDILDGRWLPR
jgi:hypothetical protein